MTALTPPPIHNIAKPISSDALVIREQWWVQLLDKYETLFAKLIIACNDALYRHNIFTQMPYAYDNELYDEYTDEAVALALKLSQSPALLDKQYIYGIANHIANEYFDSPRGLHIDDDFLKEIGEAYKNYYYFIHKE